MITRWMALPLAGVFIVSLTGCFQNPVDALLDRASEEIAEKAIESLGSAEGLDLEYDYGTDASVPDGWPASIPVPKGTITSALCLQPGDCILTITSPSESQAKADLQALKSAGFTTEWEQIQDGYVDFQGLNCSVPMAVHYGYFVEGNTVEVNITSIASGVGVGCP